MGHCLSCAVLLLSINIYSGAQLPCNFNKSARENKCFLLNVYKRVEMEMRAPALFCEMMVGRGSCGLAETPLRILHPAKLTRCYFDRSPCPPRKAPGKGPLYAPGRCEGAWWARGPCLFLPWGPGCGPSGTGLDRASRLSEASSQSLGPRPSFFRDRFLS